MAALTSADVSLYPTGVTEESQFFTGGVSGRTFVTRRLKLVLTTGQGGLTNTINAAALGFKKLVDCSMLYDATNGIVHRAVVDPVNNIIILGNLSTGVPIDVTTSAAYINVTGVT